MAFVTHQDIKFHSQASGLGTRLEIIKAGTRNRVSKMWGVIPLLHEQDADPAPPRPLML